MRPLENMNFLKQLETITPIETIYLYGSLARGDNNERSDIDLAIDAPNATSSDWNRVYAILENADTLLKVDCVNLQQLKNPKLLDNIARDKKILFTRKTA